MTTNSAVPITGYIGTYTGNAGRGSGIYGFSFDPANCKLDLVLAARTPNPSYLALSKSGQYLYAVNELSEHEGLPGGAVSAFGVETNGGLRPVNQKPSGGKLPCHIALFGAGKTFAAVANYASGTLAVLPIGEDGALLEASQTFRFSGSGPNKARQASSYAHSFFLTPDQSRGFACDLGADRVMQYRIENGALLPCPAYCANPGAGPRHGLVHPNGKIAYSLNELDSTLDALDISLPAEVRKRAGVSTLPPGVASSTAAALRLSPDARFLYASNRGHNSIAVFALTDTGLPKPAAFVPTGGVTPRDFAIDKSGNYLFACHQDSDNLVIFDIDRESGLLSKRAEHQVPSGVCIVFR